MADKIDTNIPFSPIFPKSSVLGGKDRDGVQHRPVRREEKESGSENASDAEEGFERSDESAETGTDGAAEAGPTDAKRGKKIDIRV